MSQYIRTSWCLVSIPQVSIASGILLWDPYSLGVSRIVAQAISILPIEKKNMNSSTNSNVREVFISWWSDILLISFLTFFSQSVTCILPLYPSMNLIFLMDDGTSTCIPHVFMHVAFYFLSNHTGPPKENSPLPAEGRKQWSNNWAICTFETCRNTLSPLSGWRLSVLNHVGLLIKKTN